MATPIVKQTDGRRMNSPRYPNRNKLRAGSPIRAVNQRNSWNHHRVDTDNTSTDGGSSARNGR
jgi:hypothetical protein